MRSSVAVVVAVALALAFLPSVARADDPPDGVHAWRHAPYGGWEYDYTGGAIAANGRVEERQRELIVKAGAGTLLASWGSSMLAAWIGDISCNGNCQDHAYDLLYLPVAGPAIAAALPGVTRRADGPPLEFVLVADSVIQAGAVAAILLGMLWHEKVVVVAASPRGASLVLRF